MSFSTDEAESWFAFTNLQEANCNVYCWFYNTKIFYCDSMLIYGEHVLQGVKMFTSKREVISLKYKVSVSGLGYKN